VDDVYKYVSAGQAEGIDLWENRIDKSSCQHHVSPLDKFLPISTQEEREIRFARWKDAVVRCLGWAKPKKSDQEYDCPGTDLSLYSGSNICLFDFLSVQNCSLSVREDQVNIGQNAFLSLDLDFWVSN